MRAVIQRVSHASVKVNGAFTAKIGAGMLILIGMEDADGHEDITWLTSKITNLRIFNDAEGVMNLSIKDIKGEVLVVSQFTLHASTKKGNRPSYIRASKPDRAEPLYEAFKLQLAAELESPVQSGIFGANMKVELLNDGPVTIIIDTKNKD